MEILKTVGARIRDFRKAKGLTQQQVAELTNEDVSQNYISRIESGIQFPSLKTLNKICNALQVPFYKIFITDDDSLPLLNLSPNIIKHAAGNARYLFLIENIGLLNDELTEIILEIIYILIRHKKVNSEQKSLLTTEQLPHYGNKEP